MSDADREVIAAAASDPMEFLRLAAWQTFEGHADAPDRREVAAETLARLLVDAIRASAADSDELPEPSAAVAAAVSPDRIAEVEAAARRDLAAEWGAEL